MRAGVQPGDPARQPLDVKLSSLETAPTSSTSTLRSSLDEVEEKAIREALAKTNGNQSAAARLLGIGRHALIKRIEAYGIGRPRKS